MTPPLSHLRMTGAHILRNGVLAKDDITVSEGLITDNIGPALDLAGYLIMPGIIDLHGDAFEHHMAPRPTAPFPISMGLAGTDRDAAANGVTTAWMAQSWSWEGGHRGPDFAEKFLAAHRSYQAHMLTDLRVQIRCETHTIDTEARLIAAVRAYEVDYVIFNNHLDEAVEIAQTNPERVASWADRAGRTADEHMALVHATNDRSHEVPRYLCNLATAFDNLGVRYGSHDDIDGHARERFAMIGAKICEFPTNASPAVLAKTWGDPVLMGAPNVVRGGSQSGNISATTLIRDGLCDALVSDYHYPTMFQAAFSLADSGLASLPEAWAMISTRPAQIMNLKDRGDLMVGKRADLTIINAETRNVEATMAGGRWSYLTGGVAHAVTGTRLPAAYELVAE